jgi:hypothetical protein
MTTTSVSTAPETTTVLKVRRKPGRKPDQAGSARDRANRSAGGVSDLLARRPELRGVLATADWLEESTLWSA